MSLFSVGKSSALGCPFFSRELGRSSAPRGSGPAADESELREEDVLSVTSSDPAESALLAHGVLPAM